MNSSVRRNENFGRGGEWWKEPVWFSELDGFGSGGVETFYGFKVLQLTLILIKGLLHIKVPSKNKSICT